MSVEWKYVRDPLTQSWVAFCDDLCLLAEAPDLLSLQREIDSIMQEWLAIQRETVWN